MAGASVFCLAQQVLVLGGVVAYTERWPPEALCLALATADLAREAAHTLLMRSAEPPVRAVVEIAAQLLIGTEAHLLGVPEGSAGLIVNWMSYIAPTRPAVWFRGVFRERYHLGVELAYAEEIT